jgi:uncharacterized repeat protein (TIGR03803 family)
LRFLATALTMSLVATLVGCAAHGASPLLPTQERRQSAAAFSSIYTFRGLPGGVAPAGSLIASGGELYGTTEFGGTGKCGSAGFGCGTIFSLSASHVRRTLHSFNDNDGAYPAASLIAFNGLLYGTAPSNRKGSGVVFALNPSTGRESVLHTFGGGDDGVQPGGAVIQWRGSLFGATLFGGTPCSDNDLGQAPGCGTVFTVNPSTGKETVVHRFLGGKEGAIPASGLIELNGALYGTTQYGGTGAAADCRRIHGPIFGCGTVYRINPSTGKVRVIYSFKGNKDGADPIGGLIAFEGMLYGTTRIGGGGGGTVFAINPSTGKETILHRFQGGTGDLLFPTAGLTELNGSLYGAAEWGVFEMSTSGRESVLYAIAPTNAAAPAGAAIAGLAESNGALYGTISFGGDLSCPYGNGAGCGFVFRITL